MALIDIRKIAHKQGDSLIRLSLPLGRDVECLLVQFLCGAGIRLQQIHCGQVGEGLSQARVGRRQILLQGADHLFEHPSCFGVAAQRLMGAGKVVQCRNVGEIVGAATLGGGLGFLGLCERGRIVPRGIEILKALLRGGDVDLLRHGLQWRG